MSRINLIQPDKCRITMDIWDESMSAYDEKDFVQNSNLRGTFKANLDIEFGYCYDACHHKYKITNKTFYFDNKGIYTYRKQKLPIYYWKPQNIEEDYERWSKDKNGYSIPLNEPRKLKKNYF